MKRISSMLALILVAGFAAAPPARAEHDEGAPRRGHVRPKPKPKHPVAKPKTKPGAKPPVKPGAWVKPGAAAQVPRARPLPRPQPITDPAHFVRHWAPPPSPATGATGAALTATPVNQIPSAQHTAVFSNTTVVTTIVSNQQNEVSPNRYYWHNDGGYDYDPRLFRAVRTGTVSMSGRITIGRSVTPTAGGGTIRSPSAIFISAAVIGGGRIRAQPQAVVCLSGQHVHSVRGRCTGASNNVPLCRRGRRCRAERRRRRRRKARPARRHASYHSDVDAPNYTVDPNRGPRRPRRRRRGLRGPSSGGLRRAGRRGRARAHLSALGYPRPETILNADEHPGGRAAASRGPSSRGCRGASTRPVAGLRVFRRPRRARSEDRRRVPSAAGRRREELGEHRLLAQAALRVVERAPGQGDRRRA